MTNAAWGAQQRQTKTGTSGSEYVQDVVTETVRNPFATPDGAWRYREGRPFHHPRVLDRVLCVMGMESVGLALDVACGTGLSTSALADRARVAVGVDSVEAMVRMAKPVPNALYALAAAERLPFAPETFDLLTVSSGVHWFDQEASLPKRPAC